MIIHAERGEKKIPELMELAKKKGIVISSVNLRKPTLDDVFMFYTGRYIREEEATSRESMKLRRQAWSRTKR